MGNRFIDIVQRACSFILCRNFLSYCGPVLYSHAICIIFLSKSCSQFERHFAKIEFARYFNAISYTNGHFKGRTCLRYRKIACMPDCKVLRLHQEIMLLLHFRGLQTISSSKERWYKECIFIHILFFDFLQFL